MGEDEYLAVVAENSHSVLAAARHLQRGLGGDSRQRESAVARLEEAARLGLNGDGPGFRQGFADETADLTTEDVLADALLQLSTAGTLLAAEQAMEGDRAALDTAVGALARVDTLLTEQAAGPAAFGFAGPEQHSEDLASAIVTLREQANGTVSEILQEAANVTGTVFEALKNKGPILAAIGTALDRLGEWVPLNEVGGRLLKLGLQVLEKAFGLLGRILPGGAALEEIKAGVRRLVERLDDGITPSELLLGLVLRAGDVRTGVAVTLARPSLVTTRLDEATDALRHLSARFADVMGGVAATTVAVASLSGLLLGQLGAVAQLPVLAVTGFVLVLAVVLVLAGDHLDSFPLPGRVRGVREILEGATGGG
jgi:hypothetical protein